MTKRILLSGLLGGIAMFAWSSVAHMALPLGKAGIREIPNEAGLLQQMHATVGDASGFYMFPGMGSTTMQEYQQKLAANPSGLVIYHPPGASAMEPGQLGAEFFKEVVLALLLAWLLAHAGVKSFGARMAFASVAGLLAVITTNASYFIWYRFPASYTLAYMVTDLLGILIAGAIAAGLLRNTPAATLAKAA